jgi:hypothetical protein
MLDAASSRVLRAAAEPDRSAVEFRSNGGFDHFTFPRDRSGMASARKPMQKDAFFRAFSMSKPFCGVAILMLLEEGKLRLNDPVSKFIPEFKGSKVAVVQDRPANAPA